MNQITHWIDASNIYGSTDQEAKLLRTFDNGLLVEANQKGVKDTEQLPKCDEVGEDSPSDAVSCDVCKFVKVDPDGSCFAAGTLFKKDTVPSFNQKKLFTYTIVPKFL